MAASPAFALSVAPADDLIDVPRRIVVTGLVPGAQVDLAARTLRGHAVPWCSRAAFIADADGTVDLSRDAPVCGDYTGVDPMGLVWSQRPEGGTSREVFASAATEPLTTTLTATAHGTPACARFVQRLAAPGLTRHDVRDDGLVGTLYLPDPHAHPGPRPAVMVLNGSGGGINEPRAALYASHGYAAFALAYFKAPGLSDYISNTPLEYFERGLAWLRRRVRPLHDFVAVSGQSRGGELALLLGATFPAAVSAVIGYVPGAVVHSAQNAADPAIGREGPTWLYRGRPLPHLWEGNRTATWAPFDEGEPPHRHERAIRTALRDAQAVERARIRVEQTRGPVLLLSATDDGSWPSSDYARMAAARLAEARHPYPVVHHDFAGAGHAIVFPYVPTTQLVHAHPVSGRISTGGGEPRANARADLQSWAAVRRFLAEAAARSRPVSASRSLSTMASTPVNDVVDRAAGLDDGSAAHTLRHARDKVAVATQGSHDALFDAALPGLTPGERLLVALYACRLTPAPRTGRALPCPAGRNAGRCGGPAGGRAGRSGHAGRRPPARHPRLRAHADRTPDRRRPRRAAAPARRRPGHARRGDAVAADRLPVVPDAAGGRPARPARGQPGPSGPSDRPTRRLHGDRSMTEPLRAHGFTNATLEWKAWLDVVDLDRATPGQIAVLEESHPKAKTSDYYRFLVHQPEILRQRSAAFNAIMYAPGGLSRAERELASTVVSRVNGCVYCAAVHAQRFEQLAKRNDVIRQVFEDPHTAGTNARERAIARFSIDLTLRPGDVRAEDLQPLQAAGLTDAEILDLIHAVAIFAWANRLMLNLGEPVFPDEAA